MPREVLLDPFALGGREAIFGEQTFGRGPPLVACARMPRRDRELVERSPRVPALFDEELIRGPRRRNRRTCEQERETPFLAFAMPV
jgi:hypothetical protein